MKSRDEAVLCAECGERKNHLNHPGDHTFKNDAAGGMNQMSRDRRAYLNSPQHKEAYRHAEEQPSCVFEAAGAPTACRLPITPHHVVPRSVSGDLEASERFPVISVCAGHNSDVETVPKLRAWAERTTFVWHVDGNEYFLRYNDRMYRKALEWMATHA